VDPMDRSIILVVTGDSGTGKTCMCERFTNGGNFNPDTKPTTFDTMNREISYQVAGE